MVQLNILTKLVESLGEELAERKDSMNAGFTKFNDRLSDYATKHEREMKSINAKLDEHAAQLSEHTILLAEHATRLKKLADRQKGTGVLWKNRNLTH